MGVFPGVHKGAACGPLLLYFICRTLESISIIAESKESFIFFLGYLADVNKFFREIKELQQISSSVGGNHKLKFSYFLYL